MSKNKKGIIMIMVVLIIVVILYLSLHKYLPSALGGVPKGFIKSYAKKPGEWVACNVGTFDNIWQQGQNSNGSIIYFKKSDVKVIPSGKNPGICVEAITDFNVFYKKMV